MWWMMGQLSPSKLEVTRRLHTSMFSQGCGALVGRRTAINSHKDGVIASVLDSVYTLIYIFTLFCPCLEASHAHAAVSVARRCEVVQREDGHRWSIFQHFSGTMEPSKKMKTNDIKTIVRFIPIRVGVATKNTHTCLAARRTKPGVNRPTFWLFYGALMEKKRNLPMKRAPSLASRLFLIRSLSEWESHKPSAVYFAGAADCLSSPPSILS